MASDVHVRDTAMINRTVKEIMAKKPMTLKHDDTLDLAKETMELERIRHFPVVEKEELVGVVSQRDLYRVSLGSGMRFEGNTQKEFLKTVAVKDVMSHPPVTVMADAPIREAAGLMVDKKIGCLPVLDAGKLVGLITETDLLKELLEL